MSPYDKHHTMPPVMSDRLRTYATATSFVAIRVGVDLPRDRLTALAAMCDRDVYAETVAAMGYDPLGDRDERHQPRKT